MSVMTSLFALPTTLLFFLSHTAVSLYRPVVLLSAVCVCVNPTAALRKLSLFRSTFVYLLFCKDKKWDKPPTDPALHFPGGGKLAGLPEGSNDYGVTVDRDGNSYRSKTLIFIRHGESTWNDTFNRGDRPMALFLIMFVPNLVYALFMEFYFFVSGRSDSSWFFDSALSPKGARQSEGLRKFLRTQRKLGNAAGGTPDERRAVNLLLGLDNASSMGDGPRSSKVVSSNLRRAISTAALGLSDRLAKKYDGDDILLLPCLQEISKNPDALSILPGRGTSRPTWCDTHIAGVTDGSGDDSAEDEFAALVDTHLHEGNKPVNSNGLLRMRAFCDLAFSSPELGSTDVIIAAGHSLWYKSFFATFLPATYEHISKKKKLVNGGTVMFTLREVTLAGTGKTKKEYVIDPESVTVVYGGFGKVTKS